MGEKSLVPSQLKVARDQQQMSTLQANSLTQMVTSKARTEAAYARSAEHFQVGVLVLKDTVYTVHILVLGFGSGDRVIHGRSRALPGVPAPLCCPKGTVSPVDVLVDCQ